MGEYEGTLYNIIGSMLREKRENKGYTLDDVSKHLGVTPKTLQRYEIGERKIKISTIMDLAPVLNYDYGKFMKEVKSRMAETAKGKDIPVIEQGNKINEIIAAYNKRNDLQILFNRSLKLTEDEVELVLSIIDKFKYKRR